MLSWQLHRRIHHTVGEHQSTESFWFVPLSVGMGIDANHRVTPSALLALELDIAKERIAGDAGATEQERPRQIACFPAARTRHPEMRIAPRQCFGFARRFPWGSGSWPRTYPLLPAAGRAGSGRPPIPAPV